MRTLIILAAILALQDPPLRSRSTWGRWAPGSTVKYQLTTKDVGEEQHIETLVKVEDESCHTRWTIKNSAGSRDIDRKYIYVDERPSMNPESELLEDEKITVGKKEYVCVVKQVKREDDERVTTITEWITDGIELPIRRVFSVKSKIKGKDQTFKREAQALDEVIEIGKVKVTCVRYKDRTEVIQTPGAKPEVYEEQTWHSTEVPGFLVKNDNGRTVTQVIEFSALKK